MPECTSRAILKPRLLQPRKVISDPATFDCIGIIVLNHAFVGHLVDANYAKGEASRPSWNRLRAQKASSE